MISKSQILNARILIVDDQQSNILLLKEVLRDAHYLNIDSTTNPHAVCDLHRQYNYDLILLDLQMPGMDGFSVIAELKKIDPNDYLPVLVITAQPDHKLRALTAGAKDFLAKPFDLIEAQTRIQNMLEVRLLYRTVERARQQLEQTVLERTRELRLSEARFRRLTELTSDWYWEQDTEGHFVHVFGPVFDMLGIRDEASEATATENQNLRLKEQERTELAEKRLAKRPFLDFGYIRIHPDGSLQYLMVSGEPMFDRAGRYTGYRGIGKDVTNSMRA